MHSPEYPFPGRCRLLNARDDVAQIARAVFKTTAVFARSVYRTQKFMTQIAVAMLDIYKIKACFLRQHAALTYFSIISSISSSVRTG